MKIHTDITHSVHSADKQSLRTGSIQPAKVADTVGSVGSVSISDASRVLSGASPAEAPFDVKRVEAIKAAISSGQFKVNPEAVADKVIDSASQLLTGKA